MKMIQKSKRQNVQTWKTVKAKQWLTNLKQSKIGNRKSSDTELLKADEKQDDVAGSKAAAFPKAAMQKEKVLEDLAIAQ